MDLLISAIIDLLISTGTDAFKGITGKIRLHKLKARLENEITDKIKKCYENEIYYNDLDQFLTKNKVICNLIQNCLNTSVFDYQSKAESINYYEQLFVEEHPTYFIYQSEIKVIIQRYFEVIFIALNPIKDDQIRAVSNITKELGKGLASDLAEIKDRLSEIDRKVSAIKIQSSDESSFDYKEYLHYLSILSSKQVKENYLNRSLYQQNNTNDHYDAIEALLNEKHIILLGEAGFGKTYESMELLKKTCNDERVKSLIPVFLPLYEYGQLYDSIINGIISKVKSFCTGNVELFIESLLKSGKIIFILDGIDDITNENNRAKFFADANDLLSRYADNYFFFTSRFNRYHGKLAVNKEYTLSSIDEMTVHREFQQAGIYINIPRSYYNLFANPFFLSIGKRILKGKRNKNIFDRSQLFLELFKELYIGINEKKCGLSSQTITYSEALSILGELAFETFDQPAYRIIEFDKRISELAMSDKFETITSLVCSGLFIITDKVIFTHKLLKEFCAAYHLVNHYPVTENIDLYCKLIQDEEWKEVFIFASGLFTDINKQDEFLDYVMSVNLQLYVECVNSKADLLDNSSLTSIAYAQRLLSQLYYSYTYIVNTYFKPISNLFDPRNTNKISDKKIGIFGCLSEDKKLLNYWLDFIDDSESEINCLNHESLADHHRAFRDRAFYQRRRITSYCINLELSGLNKDSGRYIAIDLIKQRLKEITNEKLLMESDYLLCERLTYIKEKVRPIRSAKTIKEMSKVIDKIVNEALCEHPEIVGYSYGDGIELFDLQAMLHYLLGRNVQYSDCILPGYDQSLENGGFIWDLFSDDQKKKRIQQFFFFHQISYLEMVKNNFPNIYNQFSRVKDAPYQDIIHINLNKCRNGISANPSIVYYYKASADSNVPLPHIIEETDEIHLHNITSTAFRDNQLSFNQLGKVSHMKSVTQTGFSFLVINGGNGKRNPLSEYVYETIRESLEEVFGELG